MSSKETGSKKKLLLIISGVAGVIFVLGWILSRD